MDWFRAHYDRLVSMVTASFLFFCAISISWNAIRFETRFNEIAGNGTQA
jgi:hypothetical protein